MRQDTNRVPVLEMHLANADLQDAEQDQLRRQLREALHSLGFHAFEQCIRDLLLRMGYTNVQMMGRTQWRQRTNHGGLDMEAHCQTGVTHTRILVQVKQYRRPVSRRFVDELRGTMLRTGAGQGLILTTSTFSRAACTAAESERLTNVRLVDGEELIDLLFHRLVGVCKEGDAEHGKHTKAFWGLDLAYFDDLRGRFPDESLKKSPQPDPSNARKTRKDDVAVETASRSYLRTTHQKGGDMLWQTHAVAGISALWLLQPVPGAVTPDNIALLTAMAAFGALLPDLDAAESKIKHLSVGRVQPFAPFSSLIYRTWGHRSLLHSLAGIGLLTLVVSVLAFWWGWWPSLGLWLGYVSHLLLDGCTRSGIPLLFPQKKRYHFLPASLRMVTGSLSEEMLFFLLALSALLFLLYQFPGLGLNGIAGT